MSRRFIIIGIRVIAVGKVFLAGGILTQISYDECKALEAKAVTIVPPGSARIDSMCVNLNPFLALIVSVILIAAVKAVDWPIFNFN